jgi:Holliday junction resolvase-like predicted endonuclease
MWERARRPSILRAKPHFALFSRDRCSPSLADILALVEVRSTAYRVGAVPTLHDEIERVLTLNGGGPMSAGAIARTVDARGRYRKRDGSSLAPEQIHARVSKYPDRFERTAAGIRLREGAAPPEHAVAIRTDPKAPWYWEGNVQATVARFLAARGWTIEAAGDAASRQRGIDLVATKANRRLAVEVKGYPGTVYARGAKAGQPKPTAPTTQARHWFAQALLTAVVTAGGQERLEVGIAFPTMPRFRDLITRSEWALRRLGIRVFLADESGRVEELPGS